jgi:hypothetical protein
MVVGPPNVPRIKSRELGGVHGVARSRVEEGESQ